MLINEIQKIIETSKINGAEFWAREDGNIHTPAGYSTIDVLNTLGDLGVNYSKYKIIQDSIDFIFKYFTHDGCFRYNIKSSKLPCITAQILTALGRLGYKDEHVDECYNHLLQIQEKDGGWRCQTVKVGKSKATDSSNPGTTLYVLDAFSYKKNTREELDKLEKGVFFLLKHWETRLPLGPCKFGIGTIFMKTEYPLLRYNILYYCYTLSKYKIARNDKRFKEAVKILTSKLIDGKLVVEDPHRAWQNFSFAQKGKISEEATKKYNEIMNKS